MYIAVLIMLILAGGLAALIGVAGTNLRWLIAGVILLVLGVLSPLWVAALERLVAS